MEEFRRVLLQFRSEKGQAYTHTSIGAPKISLHVPPERVSELLTAIERGMVKQIPMHLTERPTNPSPMRADLDFRFPLAASDGAGPSNAPPMPSYEDLDHDPRRPSLRRRYTRDHVEQILCTYFEALHSYIDLPPGPAWTAYVLEKPGPSEYRGKMKDGIHIIWPNLILDHALMHLIRAKVLDRAPQMFQGMPLCNSFEDVVDQAIIDKNNWQMYGCSKPDAPAYRVTSVYRYNPSEGQLESLPAPEASEELAFVRMFSMRGREADRTPIRAEKQDEVEEYIRHVLPTMDDRKKSKLHNQVFQKSPNLTKKRASDDELKMVRELVRECLHPRRAERYEDWIKVGWALRNIDHRLLDSWIEFSQVSSKYIEGECQQFWDRMRIDTMGIGTLRWWARQDNPKRYDEILEGNVVHLIDICANSDGAHYDVARVVHALYKDRYKFTSRDTWYTFRGDLHRWIRTREGLQLRVLLSEDVCLKFMDRARYWQEEAIRRPADDRPKAHENSTKLSQIALKLKNSGFKESIMKECKAMFNSDSEDFELLLDSHPHLLGFENGVYDLRMHEFRDGLPDDCIHFSTGKHYVPYNPEAPEIKELNDYLGQVFTSEHVRKYVMDVMACILDGGIRQERFYIFTGKGSNSKSVFLSLVQKAIGEYYCILPIALLTQKRTASNSAQAELERTKGRRCAVMQEPGESEKLNIGLMKELAGGDMIQCRGLFKEPIEFRPQFKMIMTCNDLPDVGSDDDGTWRRIRVIPFTSRFCAQPDPRNQKEFPLDPELPEKLERWAEHFLAMLINHHRHMEVKAIHEPAEVVVATNSYRSNNDVIGQWLDDRYEPDEAGRERIQIQKAYSDFKSWVSQNAPKGKKMPDRNQVTAYLTGRLGPYPSDGKGWRGMRIKTAQQDHDSDTEA